jgi:hypothetical protein
MKILTTEEVCRIEGVSKAIAIRFAHKYGVQKFAGRFLWLPDDVEKFKRRGKKRGRPKGWRKPR